MGTTEPDRSLSSGVSIPQWMKQKVGDRYDFDDSAFSPPAHDDNFFYIRYPKQVKKVKEKSKYSSINEFLEAKERISKEEAGLSDQHTSACRRYMPDGGLKLGFDTDQDPTMSALRRKGPQVLDGVEEESCGQSVVQVAQQMTGHITGAVLQSGIRAYVEVPSRLKERRGSKSLPTSPLTSPQTSPKTGRRAAGPVAHNRYFTPVMTLTPASGGRTSILSRLLGGDVATRNRLTSSEDEEESAETSAASVGTKTAELRRNKSTSALLGKGVEGLAQAEGESLVQKVSVLKPKPSELREMNFWSPTSM